MATYDSALRLAHANKLDFATTFLYYLDNTTWKVIPLLQEPVSVNYTIDDSQDNATICFISTTLTSKLDNGTLMSLVYAGIDPTKSQWGLAEVEDTDYIKPLNHDILAIKSGRCYRKGNSSYYFHEYALVELIDLMKEVTMETLTFSSDEMVKVKYLGEGTEKTYYKTGYNAYTILERILKLTRTPTNLVDDSWFNKIEIMDTTWLATEMIGVDDTFNENTLYDAFIKIGGYLGRYPVLYFKRDYDGTNAQFALYYEKREVNRTSPITLASLVSNATDVVESDDSPIAQTIVANAKNMVGSKLIYYPSKTQWTPASNKDLEALTVGANDDLCIEVDYPISQVVALRKLTYVVQYIDGVRQTPTETYAVVPCFKYEDWLVQDDRDNKAYFKENENIIYFGQSISLTGQGYDYLGESSSRFTYILWQVQMYTNIQASAIIGDSDYSQFFNQADSLVDSATFAKQVENYQKANSGSDFTISKIANTYADILKCGQLVTSGSKKYFVSGVSFNTFNYGGKTSYKVAYQLNEDIVRRNLFIKANDGIRTYQTYYENTHERFINIKEKINLKIRFGDATITGTNTFKYIVEPKIVMGRLWLDEPMIETAFIKTQSVVATAVGGTPTETLNKYLQFNCNKTQFGNSILLNLKAKTNVALGNAIGEVVGNDPQTQRQVIYTDPFGCIDELQVGVSGLIAQQELMAYNFPVVEQATYTTAYANSYIKIANLYLDKDSREILNLTMQFDFVASSGTEISSDLVGYSGLLGSAVSGVDNFVFYIFECFIGTNEIGDIASGSWVATITNPAYYNSSLRGTNLFLTEGFLMDETKEYFLTHRVNNQNKIIAKIDSSSIIDNSLAEIVTIYF